MNCLLLEPKLQSTPFVIIIIFLNMLLFIGHLHEMGDAAPLLLPFVFLSLYE